jgi:hypothetical protein
VLYVLSVVLAAVSGFIAVLVYLDASPKAALDKVMARALRRPERPRARHVAPYRRIADSNTGSHRPVLMNLGTSDGSGQACHPDVLYVPEGFGAEAWPYWMVCTPYPYMDSSVENPEVFVSCDGINWVIPAHSKNPLVPNAGNAGDHNSDPDLLLHDGELFLFYRETIRGIRAGSARDTNTLYLLRSSDGTQWTTPVAVLHDSSGKQLLSPAVVHQERRFLMWTIEANQGVLNVVRRTSSDAVNWGSEQPISVLGLPKERQPWHIDVLPERDRLSAILVSCTGPGGVGSRMHYAHSDDGGLTWFADDFLIEQAYEFESKLQYRASLQKIDENQNRYGLWYSAASHSDVFYIAYLELGRTSRGLRPISFDGRRHQSLIPVK